MDGEPARRKRRERRTDDPSYYRALGRAIKVLRFRRGLERKDLANASGVSYPYLAEIENGKKRPSSRTLLAVAGALGLRPDELLASAEELRGDTKEPDVLPVESPAMPSVASAALSERVSPSSARTPIRRWFSGPRETDASSPPEPEPEAGRPAASGRQEEALEELRGLLSRMAPEDVERLLDLARRLAP